MKLKYKKQQFQQDAAQSVVDIFRGQPYTEGQEYLIDQGRHQGMIEVTGFGNNPLRVDAAAMTQNVQEIQRRNDLQPIDHLRSAGRTPMFTIEMETGTGKTYTYIKTMYELNRAYGWSKFIIVVPSVAIREGVHKSFETMREHFLREYEKSIQYFIYNSKQLSKIDSFAQDSGLHVMIINMQAFNSSLNQDKNQEGRSGDAAARIIFSKRDEFGSRRPIDIIARTNPILIIDEPQSVLGANKENATRRGMALFNPLFMLLYSATHRKGDIYNMVYRLDAMDAYNRKLVKQIEVKGVSQVGTTATNGFVYLDGFQIGKGNPQARLTYDVKSATGFRQTTKLLREGQDLYAQSGELEEYADRYVIERIDAKEGYVRFLNGLTLYEGDAAGHINEDALRRIQIRETIRTHLERERILFPKGIKVLSLFFIDQVANYRQYGKDGVSNGKFADMFEEEYPQALEELDMRFGDDAYMQYLKRQTPQKAHQGYFAQDKKGQAVDVKVKKAEESANDENALRAYDLIMKDKERLLSFDEPVRFIFSHSALKEGWDNPNVFQICTLKDSGSEIKKRQEVGRGMRLCVNNQGERQDQDVLGESGVFDTNVLTVIASESYDTFAKALQKEIADNIGDRIVVVGPEIFKDVIVADTRTGISLTISEGDARKIYNRLVKGDYVDDNGRLTDKYYAEQKSGKFTLGEDLEELRPEVEHILARIFDPQSIKIENGRKVEPAKFREEAFKRKEFQELWKRINVKTYYQVDFDTPELVGKAVAALDKHLKVTEIRILVERGALGEIHDKKSLEDGVAMTAGEKRTVRVEEAVSRSVKYDLVGRLVEATGLTRRTIVAILKGIAPATFAQFKHNPEEFIVKAGNIINDEKAMAVVQQIVYQKSSNTYDVDIFTESELRGKIGKNAIASVKSLYDMVVVDSEGVEMQFAESLEHEEDVAVYTKLPRGFYINTPMGHYNPDWAVCFREGSVKHIYFIAETKGNEWQRSQLRGAEEAKLECAARHFEVISRGDRSVAYGVAKDYQTLYDQVMK